MPDVEPNLIQSEGPVIHELSLPDTPPSLNTTGASHGWRKFASQKKNWEGLCFYGLLEAKVPKRAYTRIEATAVLRFPQKRRRDEGNFRVILEKALGDALQLGDWLPDDTPDFYSFGGVSFSEDAGKPLTIVRLTCHA